LKLRSAFGGVQAGEFSHVLLGKLGWLRWECPPERVAQNATA
jgi:hypothetical protein